ncbi:hypothetical protein DTO013E5_10136 [Penicillium roqueforti]|nr:hypothetical protein DTO012A1_8742 [Penicillium roqueforti]CAG7915515.1 unnamed protein product [Penicillium olsonii]CAG7949546.1 unnamed protein product [Penicillium salamii]KAI2738921.1 hypothetical protein DTO013F2_9475 [Penicillium roqueforti]KAI2756350.1 hypothetical protein DTO006G1_7990 [Penicillium roqueforti]
MADLGTQNMRDGAIIATISIFGISYFSLFGLQFLLFHFPSSPAMILNSLSLIFFSGGAILWYLFSLVYRAIAAFNDKDTTDWQILEFGGALVLIYAATIPSVVLLFPTLPSVQLGYLFSFTLVAVGNLVDFLAWDLSSSVARLRFPYHCTSLCLFSLVPIIHALTGTLSSISPLAVQFGQCAMFNALGATLYLLRPLERLCVFGGWRLELYVMHSILAYSVVIYSQAVLCAVLESAQ